MSTAVVNLLFSAAALLPCFVGLPFSVGRRVRPVWLPLSAVLCFALCFAFALAFPQLPLLPALLCAALYLAWGMLLFSERWYLRLAVAASHLLGAVLSIWITVATLLPNGTLADALALPLPSLFSFCLLLLFTGVLPMSAVPILMRILLRRGDDRRSNLVWLMFPPFPLCQFFLIDRVLSRNGMDELQALYLLFAVLLCLGSDVALAFGVRSVERSAALRARYAALNRQIAAQTVYYRQVADYLERIRQMRHDLRNHVYTLRILLEENPAEAAAYSEQLRRERPLGAPAQLCAHPIADLYLSQKLSDLAKENLVLKLDLCIPAALKIPNGDLIGALDNLIACAANVCRRTHETQITLSADYAAPFLILKVDPAFAVKARRSPREEAETDVAVLLRLAERYAGNLSVRDTQGTEATVLLLQEGASV